MITVWSGREDCTALLWITGHSMHWVVVGGSVLDGHSSNELTRTKPLAAGLRPRYYHQPGKRELEVAWMGIVPMS